MDFTTLLNLVSRYTTTQNTTTSSYPTANKTTDINSALNWYMIMANQSAGNWRPADDTNQANYPIVFTDLISGQQDYVLTNDESGNQILDVYKVRLLQPDGITWKTLTPVDVNDVTKDDQIYNLTTNGTPERFYITANGIFLVNPPNYSWRLANEGKQGIEVYINRTPTYFVSSDTTKKAGIPWVHHEYLALRPSWLYCVQKGMPQANSYAQLLFGADGKSGMEGAIKAYYSNRTRYEQRKMTPRVENNK